ncbi:MAG: J domain-containing protein [Chthoniobacter sp.]
MPIKIRPHHQSKVTHYDNLKVSEKAPLEVIKAAYRVLSMRWHPDRNPGDPQAGKIMAILNAAYEVLSDPAKREEYDARLAASRRTSATSSPGNFASATTWSPRPSPPFSFWMVLRSLSALIPNWKLVFGTVVIVGFSALLANTVAHHDSTKKAEPMATAPATTAEPAKIAQDTIIGEAVPQPLEQPAVDLRLINPLDGHPWPKNPPISRASRSWRGMAIRRSQWTIRKIPRTSF